MRTGGETQSPPPEVEGKLTGIRLRAILTALAFAAANVAFCMWGNWTEGVGASVDSVAGPAIAGLFLISLFNRALVRRRPRWAFAPGELIVVYVALALSSCLCPVYTSWGEVLAPSLTWPAWNASPANDWANIMLPNLPGWLIVTDPTALEAFYLGDTNPYQQAILRAWASPAFWWTAWMTALLWTSLCLYVILRRRWSREEQLPFPMTILPLRMAHPRGELLGTPLFWIGFAASGLVYLLNILANFFPALSTIPTYINLEPYIAQAFPWNGMRSFWLDWSPHYIGLCYLMPVDLAFSLIVFNLWWRAEYILSRQMGWMAGSPWTSEFPYGDQQTIGCYLALVCFVLWLDRRYLAQVLRRAAGLRSQADDSEEVFSYRTAAVGAVAGLGFLWWFLARGGMTAAVAAAFLFIYFVMVLAMGRIRAQIGPPIHDMGGVMPRSVLTEFPGIRSLRPRGLAMLALLLPYTGFQGTNPAPVQLESLRMAESTGLQRNRFAWVMMGAIVLGMLVYFWANIDFGSRLGLGTGEARHGGFRDSAQQLNDWLRNPKGANFSGVAAIGVGFAATIILMALKLNVSAWPLHPIAFPLAFGWVMDTIMPCVIFTWIVKSLLLRYGGLRAHRRALPFFLGLIVGGHLVYAGNDIVNRISNLLR